MKPRNSLPPTGNGKVDKVKLKNLLARSSVEMEKCVDSGEMPIFGYPPVCFSPIGNKKEIKDKFWRKLYDNTMKAKKEGHERSQLVMCFDKYDEF